MAAATRGPAPKRSTERRRRNAESKPDVVQLPAGAAPKLCAPLPAADPEWHHLAKEWYESLALSGQAQYFEPSDWTGARIVAQAISACFSGSKVSSMMVAAVWSAMGDLGTTEAQRRRIRMEIDRGGEPEKPAGVTALADYRKSLGAGKLKKS